MSKKIKLDKEDAAQILEAVFYACGQEANSVPLEELENYTSYRSESYSLQRQVLHFLLVCFMILPLLFVQPDFEVQESAKGERGLPELSIDVSTMLPVKRVIATMNGYRLPVYVVSKHYYTVEPTSNGRVELMVELFNGQVEKKHIQVTSSDSEPPILRGAEITPSQSVIYVEDIDTGVNYDSIYSVTPNGEKKYPIDWDKSIGSVTFDYDITGSTLFIEDNYKNCLQIKK